MLVYHDRISNDELLSDSFKVEEMEDIIYRVPCKMITKGSVEVNIGANPSTEDGEDASEAVDDEAYQVIDVVDCFRLEETVFTKKTYMLHIKDYMKTIKAKLEDINPNRVSDFEKGASSFVKKIFGDFNKYQFFVGENMDPEAMVMLFETLDDGTQYMYYWKDGLRAEKY